MTTCSYGWPSLDQPVVAEVVHVLDERFDALADFAFPHLLAVAPAPQHFISGERFAQDSTIGPFPDRKTAWVGRCSSRRCRVAMFKPTSVLPAPGTPVTKQIIFRLLRHGFVHQLVNATGCDCAGFPRRHQIGRSLRQNGVHKAPALPR